MMRTTLIALTLCLMASTAFAQGVLPDPETTPGTLNPKITQANINDTICKKGWSTKSIRPPVAYTNKLKKAQIKAQHLKDTKLGDYEEDHLISLELGGHPSDVDNLWLEKYAGKCGARVKDHLEDHLHELVCSGKLTLKQAQDAIAGNWVKAYNKYVGSLTCGQ